MFEHRFILNKLNLMTIMSAPGQAGPIRFQVKISHGYMYTSTEYERNWFKDIDVSQENSL